MATLKQGLEIGIFAPSSCVPQIELGLGVNKIKELGFSVKIHPQCRKSDWHFSGTDTQRAQAFYDFAKDDKLPVLWAARGGYGAIRLLPVLDELTQRLGPPPQSKLLIGYSDITVLMEYVRERWGWSTLHGPLPSMRKFTLLPEVDFLALRHWIRKSPADPAWAHAKLKPVTAGGKAVLLKNVIEAPLVGGNLCTLTTLLGTRYLPGVGGKILFLEDIDEAHYRIDRMVQQLVLSGFLEGVRAIVLGNFMSCNDVVPSVLKKSPRKMSLRTLENLKGQDLKPLRKTRSPHAGIEQIFGELSRRLGIPIYSGLPVGHGPEVSPLPLGANYRLLPKGRLELLEWSWLRA